MTSIKVLKSHVSTEIKKEIALSLIGLNNNFSVSLLIIFLKIFGRFLDLLNKKQDHLARGSNNKINHIWFKDNFFFKKKVAGIFNLHEYLKFKKNTNAYNNKYGFDLFITILLLGGLLSGNFYLYLKNSKKYLKNNWKNERCKPYVIPFAGYIHSDEKDIFLLRDARMGHRGPPVFACNVAIFLCEIVTCTSYGASLWDSVQGIPYGGAYLYTKNG